MRDVAIVGAGQTAYGDHPESSGRDLFAAAYDAMVDSVDRGVATDDVDEAVVGSLGVGGAQLGLAGPAVTAPVGLTGIPAQRVENACASGGYALLEAVKAIRAGTADVVLVGGVEKMRDLSGDRAKYWLGVSGDTAYERLAGMTFAGVYAIMARRYLHETDATREHLGLVAVKNHDNGAANPKAHFQRAIALESAVDAPAVCAPLGLYDCCPTTDGAACTLVVAGEHADRFTDDPVMLTGFGAGSDHVALHDRETITSVPAARRAADAAYRRAGRTPEEIDLAELHDCFTVAELMAYEDCGFAEPGEGWRLIEDGVTARDGALPTNTSGGLKAKGHPLGATGVGQVVEVFEQLRGEAGARQVDAEVALSHNVGGSGGAAAAFVYEVAP